MGKDRPQLADRIDEAATASTLEGTAKSDASTGRFRGDFILWSAGKVPAAFPVADVQELAFAHDVTVTALPNLPSPFLGVTRRRGRLLPLVDLATVLTDGTCERTGEARLMVCHHRDGHVGFFVDVVEGLYEFDGAAFKALAPGSWSRASMYVASVVQHDDKERLVLSLDALWTSLRELVPVKEAASCPKAD